MCRVSSDCRLIRAQTGDLAGGRTARGLRNLFGLRLQECGTAQANAITTAALVALGTLRLTHGQAKTSRLTSDRQSQPACRQRRAAPTRFVRLGRGRSRASMQFSAGCEAWPAGQKHGRPQTVGRWWPIGVFFYWTNLLLPVPTKSRAATFITWIV